MKNWRLVNLKSTLLCFFLGISTVFAQEKVGINFIDNDWQKSLQLAQQENKVIFIDAYTTWCGPCKMMDRDVFSDSAVAIWYNDNFVNLKLDMEKGDGPMVAEKYGVRGYPSFLFIDANQNLVHRGIGYQPIENFKKLGSEAVDPTKQLGVMARAYQRGDRSDELCYHYAIALLKAGDQKGIDIGKNYLDGKENWATPDHLELVRRLVRDFEDPYYNFMVKKKHLFYKQFGENHVNASFENILQRHYYSQIDKVDLKEVKSKFEQTFTASKAIPLYDLFEVNYHDISGDTPSYIEAAKSYVKKYPTLSANTLNEISWNFYEKVDDQAALKLAKKWAKKSIKKESSYFNNDTLAALYYKLGKKKPAIKYAQRAIELAKKTGAPYDETTALLDKINSL